MTDKPTIFLYTDGSSRGNPGPGGWGAVLRCGKLQKELSAGYRLTTNNRMELTAVIEGLSAILWSHANVEVWSDSTYVVKAVSEGWLAKWESTGFRKVKNVDLWKRFLAIYKLHNVSFHWIKGHAGHPENERCDRLAVEAAEAAALGIDRGYEYEMELVAKKIQADNKK